MCFCLEYERLINDKYDYCIDHAFDDCVCGNLKQRNKNVCSECDYNITKKEIGFSICPLCNDEFIFSKFLNTAIKNEKTRLIANLITHYRHVHQSSWNTSCHFISNSWGQLAYAKAKDEHNNRAKRQILRKCFNWVNNNGIKKENFLELQNNDEKTIELINKIYK